MDKLCYIHSSKYYSTVKNTSKLLIHAITWIYLTNTKESGRIHLLNYFIYMKLWKRQNYGKRNHTGGFQGLGYLERTDCKEARWGKRRLLSLMKVKVLVAQLCLILCNPMDCSPPGYSIHGIFQTRILEWVAISFSRLSSQPRDQTWVSHIAGRLLPYELPGKPQSSLWWWLHSFLAKLIKLHTKKKKNGEF